MYPDREAGRAQVALQRSGEAEYGVLRRRVDGETRDGAKRGHRCKGDHVLVPGGRDAHAPDGRAGAPHDAQHVRLDDQADVGIGVLPRLLGAQDAGVVDPHDQAPALGGLRGDRAMPVGVAHVQRPRPGATADFLGGLLGARRVQVGDEHVVATAGEPAGDLASAAAAAARYDGDAALLRCACAHGLSALTISRGRGPTACQWAPAAPRRSTAAEERQ